MLKVRTIVQNARQGAQKFFTAKIRKEDWLRCLPMDSRLPPNRVRNAVSSALVLGGKAYSKVEYHEQEPLRGARARV